MFVDVRIADKVRGQGAGSVLTAAQIETIVRTALQAFHSDSFISSRNQSHRVVHVCPPVLSVFLQLYLASNTVPAAATRNGKGVPDTGATESG